MDVTCERPSNSNKNQTSEILNKNEITFLIIPIIKKYTFNLPTIHFHFLNLLIFHPLSRFNIHPQDKNVKINFSLFNIFLLILPGQESCPSDFLFLVCLNVRLPFKKNDHEKMILFPFNYFFILLHIFRHNNMLCVTR